MTDCHKNDTGQGHQPGHPGWVNGRGHHRCEPTDTIDLIITDDADDAGAVLDVIHDGAVLDIYRVEPNPWFAADGGDLILRDDMPAGTDPDPVLAMTSAGWLWLDAYNVSGG